MAARKTTRKKSAARKGAASKATGSKRKARTPARKKSTRKTAAKKKATRRTSASLGNRTRKAIDENLRDLEKQVPKQFRSVVRELRTKIREDSEVVLLNRLVGG